MSSLPNIRDMAREPAAGDEDGVDADEIAVAHVARGERFGGCGDAAQAIVVERKGGFRGAPPPFDFDECKGGSAAGNALVLVGALAAALQIVALERFAPRYDARALTFLQMATSFVGFLALALVLGELEVPRGGTVWAALLVTGLFAGALGFLVATWVQARTTAARAALVFTLEAPFAALAGVLLADEVLGPAGWLGCGVMMAGILLAEPFAANALRRVLPRGR